ncbi:MAG: hypothetical protein WKG07_41555 [Hymenobacter sp.]
MTFFCLESAHYTSNQLINLCRPGFPRFVPAPCPWPWPAFSRAAFWRRRPAMFNGPVVALAALTTILLQILSNLANDYGDSQNGADSVHRAGAAARGAERRHHARPDEARHVRLRGRWPWPAAWLLLLGGALARWRGAWACCWRFWRWAWRPSGRP